MTHGVLTLADLTDVSLTAARWTPQSDPHRAYLALNASRPVLQYTPDENFNGSDSLSLLVSTWQQRYGRRQADSASRNLEVSAVNDDHVNLIPAAQTTAEDTALTLSGPLAIRLPTWMTMRPGQPILASHAERRLRTLSLPAGVFTLPASSGDHTAPRLPWQARSLSSTWHWMACLTCRLKFQRQRQSGGHHQRLTVTPVWRQPHRQ